VSAIVGLALKQSTFVIYESKIYPDFIEEICFPVPERESGLKLNKNFFVVYSPEDVVPDDKAKTLATIKKISSVSMPETAEKSIISIAHHYCRHMKASSLKVA
jgi:UDP-N-acetyl-D-galactosamine dehydrogenase